MSSSPAEHDPPALCGDDGVDEAVRTLAEVRSQPAEQQVETFTAVQRALQDRLGDIEG